MQFFNNGSWLYTLSSYIARDLLTLSILRLSQLTYYYDILSNYKAIETNNLTSNSTKGKAARKELETMPSFFFFSQPHMKHHSHFYYSPTTSIIFCFFPPIFKHKRN